MVSSDDEQHHGSHKKHKRHRHKSHHSQNKRDSGSNLPGTDSRQRHKHHDPERDSVHKYMKHGHNYRAPSPRDAKHDDHDQDYHHNTENYGRRHSSPSHRSKTYDTRGEKTDYDESRKKSKVEYKRESKKDDQIDYHSNTDGMSSSHKYEHTKRKSTYDNEEDNKRCKHKMTDDQDAEKKSCDEKTNVNSDDESGVGPDYEINWESYRYLLNRIFFTEKDHIKRGSQTYDDFWAFLKKYTDFQRRKAARCEGSEKKASSESMSSLGLPSRYDKRYRINMSLSNKDLGALHRKHVAGDRKGADKELIVDRLVQFRRIILHYLDFIQKQKFSKLMKIRTDQQNLPIYQYKQQIIDTVGQNQVVVVAGDTGCGKSTQVPQYLLEAGYTEVACTQPRRIACISLAKRVSYETLNEYGSEVAHQVRFEKTKTKATRILFLTEGLLLRQIGSDDLLSKYNVIVIDEVHERHIHTDFLLGVIKCVLLQREDLKLVLMSATININLFSGYFDNCPVVKVPGRLHPIQLQYIPLTIEEQGSKTERLDPTPYIRVLQLINHKYPDTERGDVLMFLSGMSEIMAVSEAASMYTQKNNKWIILPLHSSLSIAEQDKVFDIAPDGVRKCIISTNIAETSVTIDGVRFVVDSGKVKEMSFDTKYKMQRLQEFWISRASSEQRKGRAGRTGPGVCFRLYAEADYDALQEYSTPEIMRVPLDSLILQMITMGLPDARKFPYLEPPDESTIETSIAFLKEQGALSAEEELTPIGQMLSQLPVDVIIGKMLIMASIFQLVDPVLSIAASLSVQSPFTAKAQRDVDAMHNRKTLESDHGDPITFLNALDEWVLIKAEGRDTRKWCRRRGLEQQRFYEIAKLKKQFQDILQDYGLVATEESEEPAYMTREERRLKNIERKQLRDLKSEQRRQGKSRKVLKLEDQDWELAEVEGEDTREEPADLETNIKDLEFRISNDLSKMQEKHNRSRSLTLREITLLKVILCSGLFPQVAIADEHNSFKPDTEQAFHTKTKGFVLLHPTSVFAQKTEALDLQEHETKEGKDRGQTNRGHLSNKHQLLTYVLHLRSLLETMKPYLTGCLRVPALQTLFLFSSLDTNSDCTRVLCDGWLEVRFEDPEEAESVLSSAVKLRHTWLQLLELKLQVSGSNKNSLELNPDIKRTIARVQRILSKKLTEFLNCDVFYYIRRVLTAELNRLYIGPITDPEGGGSVQSTLGGLLGAGGEPHPVKGGVIVNPYLVYNCLQDDESVSVYGEYTSCMQRHWTCPECGDSLIVTLAERLQHEQQCQENLLQGKDKSGEREKEEEKNKELNALRKSYRCDICKKDFNFTTTEIFKHKKTCS